MKMYRLIFCVLLLYSSANAQTLDDAIYEVMHGGKEHELLKVQEDLALSTFVRSFTNFMPNISYQITHIIDSKSNLGPLGTALGSVTSSLSGIGALTSLVSTGYRSFSIGMDITLYKSIPLAISSAMQFDMSKENFKIQKSTIVNKTVSAYMNAISAKQKIEMLERAKKVAEKQVAKDDISKKYNAISEDELFQSEAKLLEIEAGIDQAQSDLNQAESEYKALSNGNSLVDPVMPVVNYEVPFSTLEGFMASVSERNPIIKSNKINVQMWKTQSTAAILDILPQFALTYSQMDIGAGFTGAPYMNFAYFGVSMTIPIFDQGKTWINAYAAYKQNRAAILTKDIQEQEALSSAVRLWNGYQSLKKILIAKEKYLSIATNTFSKAVMMHRNNSISEATLLNSEANMIQKNIDLIDTVKNYIITYNNLLSAAGVNPFID